MVMEGTIRHSALQFSNHLLEFEILLAQLLIHLCPKFDLLHHQLLFKLVLIFLPDPINLLNLMLARSKVVKLAHHIL
jgi:hypothetical protein